MGDMTTTTKKVLDRVTSWPEEDQEELVEAAREIEARRAGVYQLRAGEREGVERGLEAMRKGNFANDEMIAGIFRKARSPRT